MRKEVILSAKPATLGAFAALCAALVLMAGGCARTTTRVEKSGTTAADTAVGDRKANNAPAVRVSAERTEAAEPAAAPAHDGTVYVAWVEHRGKEADVWLAHFDGEGKSARAARRASTRRRARPRPGADDPPTVAVAPDGTVYVGWTARDEAAPHAGTLYLSASRDGGRSFGPPSKVNDDAKPGVHGMHSLAVSRRRARLRGLARRARHRAAGGRPRRRPLRTSTRRATAWSTSPPRRTAGAPSRRTGRVAGEVCPCCKTSLAVGRGRARVRQPGGRCWPATSGTSPSPRSD